VSFSTSKTYGELRISSCQLIGLHKLQIVFDSQIDAFDYRWEMKNVAGMILSNPCMRFQTLHNHASDLRRNTNENQVNLDHNMVCAPSSNLEDQC
jgi:hypothetical protein